MWIQFQKEFDPMLTPGAVINEEQVLCTSNSNTSENGQKHMYVGKIDRLIAL